MTTNPSLTIATRWNLASASRSVAVAALASLLLLACAGANPQASSSSTTIAPAHQDAPAARGETVADIGNSCWVGFQDKDDNHWFGSDGNGVFRYDGKTLTRFTTKDGLVHDQIRGIQQHAPTGDILITTNGGVSKFDGQRFETLPITEMQPPNAADLLNALANEGLKEGWLLNADDLWLTGAGGPRRYDGKTLYQLKFPKSPLEEELSAKYGTAKNWSSYDVWTVYKDSKGHMWFGTAVFGISRFDGQHIDWMFESHLTEFDNGGWFGFRAIIEDRNGDYWFNSTQYRYKVEPHGVTGQEPGKLKYTREQGMDWSAVNTTDKFIHFQAVTQDSNGDLWMAPYAGGVWRHDGKKGTHYPMTVGDAPNQITMFSIYKDNHGDLWVGTHEHGAYKFNGKAFERFRP
jgi:ligand-binding sensor domain-containing protein